MNIFALCTDQENNGEEVIANVIFGTESCSNNVDNVSQKKSIISDEIKYDIEVNDMSNDWSENLHEYDIDDQLDGSDSHFSEIDAESIDISQGSILIAHMMMVCTIL